MYLFPFPPRLTLFLVVGTLFSFGAVEDAVGQDGVSLQPRLSYQQRHVSPQLETSLLRNGLAAKTAGLPCDSRAIPVHVDAAGLPATGWLLRGGAAGSAVGVFGGAFVGGVINAYILQVQLLGFGIFTGAVLGSMTMTPLGVHIVNGRRGSYLRGLLGSVAAVAATLFIMSEVADGSEIYVAASGVAVQVGLSTLIEHATSR